MATSELFREIAEGSTDVSSILIYTSFLDLVDDDDIAFAVKKCTPHHCDARFYFKSGYIIEARLFSDGRIKAVVSHINTGVIEELEEVASHESG